MRDGGEAGAGARTLHAGSGAARARRDGGDHGAIAGGCERNLQKSRAGGSGLAREFEFAGADRDFGRGGSRKTRRGNRFAIRSEACGDAAGIRPISLRVDGAGATAAGAGPEKSDVWSAEVSGDYE